VTFSYQGLVHRKNQPGFPQVHRTLERKSLAQVTTIDAGFPVAERNPIAINLQVRMFSLSGSKVAGLKPLHSKF
jgi:hypothetical protein